MRYYRPSFVVVTALLAGIAQAQAAPPDMVASLDTDHDGVITRAEFAAPLASRFDRMDADHDGRIAGNERPSYHGEPAPVQTRAEFMARAMGVFDGEDTNKDGRIDGDELVRLRAHIAGGNAPRPKPM